MPGLLDIHIVMTETRKLVMGVVRLARPDSQDIRRAYHVSAKRGRFCEQVCCSSRFRLEDFHIHRRKHGREAYVSPARPVCERIVND